MKNIPNKVYIQIGKDITINDDFDFDKLNGISWCAERINKSDIVYVRNKKKVIPEDKPLPCPFCGKQPKQHYTARKISNYTENEIDVLRSKSRREWFNGLKLYFRRWCKEAMDEKKFKTPPHFHKWIYDGWRIDRTCKRCGKYQRITNNYKYINYDNQE